MAVLRALNKLQSHARLRTYSEKASARGFLYESRVHTLVSWYQAWLTAHRWSMNIVQRKNGLLTSVMTPQPRPASAPW